MRSLVEMNDLNGIEVPVEPEPASQGTNYSLFHISVDGETVPVWEWELIILALLFQKQNKNPSLEEFYDYALKYAVRKTEIIRGKHLYLPKEAHGETSLRNAS